MAIIKDRQYLYGTAAPQIQEPRRQEPKKEPDWIKREKEHQRQQLKIKNKNKIKTYAIIMSVGLLFGFTLFRSAEIYEVQASYNTMIKETQKLHKDNEGLRAEIIKISSISNIVEESKSLDLVQVTHDEYLDIDMNKNNFIEEETVAEKESIFSKIFSFISPSNHEA